MTGRAVPVAKVSGLVTTLVAPRGVGQGRGDGGRAGGGGGAGDVGLDLGRVGEHAVGRASTSTATEARVRPVGQHRGHRHLRREAGHGRVVDADRRPEDGRRPGGRRRRCRRRRRSGNGSRPSSSACPARSPGRGRSRSSRRSCSRRGTRLLVGQIMLHREPAAVGVAHGVVLVPAVAGPGAVRRGRRDAAEVVHQLVRLDGVLVAAVAEAPAAASRSASTAGSSRCWGSTARRRRRCTAARRRRCPCRRCRSTSGTCGPRSCSRAPARRRWSRRSWTSSRPGPSR